MQMPQFTEQRIKDWKNPNNIKEIIELDTLFTAVSDDDKGQPDQCMKLQLDASLIDKNYKKLDPEMRRSLINLLSEKLALERKHIQVRFESQNYELGLLSAQLKDFNATVDERMQYFKAINDKIRFNRFINKTVNKRGMQKNKVLEVDNPKMTVKEDMPSHTRKTEHNFTTIIESHFDKDMDDFLGSKKSEKTSMTRSATEGHDLELLNTK